MICLTGDIHHTSLGTGNQRHSDVPEVRVAARYLRMLEEAGVKVTFFVSGRLVLEEWPDLAPICASEQVEIGGHNVSCLTPELFHRASKKLLGSYNGPAWVQRLDARLTRDIIRRRAGRTIRAFRNHMYMHGPHTESALAAEGIRFCSDGVKAASTGPEWHPAGLFNVPLNVIPDHEHLYHAERTPAWVAQWQRRYHFSDDFGPASYHVEEWTDLVLDCLRTNEARGAVSTMIIHPITLYLADNFRSFGRILDFVAARETVFMSDLDRSDLGTSDRGEQAR
ncbi:MAG: polysaccharide deacetylase family protein [Byssovorax sp.]